MSVKDDRLLAEMALRNWLILLVLVLLSLLWRSAPVTLGVLAGGLLVIFNYRSMGKSLTKLLGDPQQAAQKGFKLNYLFRLAFIACALYLLIVRAKVHPLALVVGPFGGRPECIYHDNQTTLLTKEGHIGVSLWYIPFLFLNKLGQMLHVNDEVIYTWLVMLILIVVSFLATRSIKLVPGGVQNFMESIVTGIQNLIEETIGAKKARLSFRCWRLWRCSFWFVT